MRKIWTDELIIKNISSVTSFSELALKIGLSRSTNTDLRKRAIQLNLDFSHFRNSGYKPKPLKLEINTKYSSGSLRRRLIKEGYFDEKCCVCGLKEWNGQKISLELEHKNGIRTDHRIENLTILCPNCHAQTIFYRGKNTKISREKILKILDKKDIVF